VIRVVYVPFMENDQVHGSAPDAGPTAAPPEPQPAAFPIDLNRLLPIGKAFLSDFLREGKTPEWAKWALGAAVVGAVVGFAVGGRDEAPEATAFPPPPFPSAPFPPPGPFTRSADVRPSPVRREVEGAPFERYFKKIREYPLVFFQSGIGPLTGAIDVTSRPQVPFDGDRLIIPESYAPHFAVIDIKVGNRSQLANSTAIPAMSFVPTVRSIRFALDRATVAQDISIVVENITGDAQTFMATLIGTAMEPCDVCGAVDGVKASS